MFLPDEQIRQQKYVTARYGVFECQLVCEPQDDGRPRVPYETIGSSYSEEWKATAWE